MRRWQEKARKADPGHAWEGDSAHQPLVCVTLEPRAPARGLTVGRPSSSSVATMGQTSLAVGSKT